MSTIVQLGDRWQETFTATETWVCPSIGVDGFEITNLLRVLVRGRGGAGGAASALAGGGGGGGAAYSEIANQAVTPGSSYAVAVPTSGAVVSFSIPGPTVVCSANSGTNGAAGNLGTGGAGGAGGTTGGVGTTKFAGGLGGTGSTLTGGGGGGSAGDANVGGAASAGTAGTGGAAQFGAETGNGATGAATGVGAVGSIAGGGGAGGGLVSSAGGNGGRGEVVIEYNRRYSKAIAETAPASDSGTNLVTGTFEGGTTESWLSSDFTLTNTAAQAHAGTKSLQVQSLGTGQRSALSAPVVCTAGQYMEGLAWFRSAVTARAIVVTLNWYSDTSGVTFISQTLGQLIADTTSGWTLGSVVGTAPSTAIRCRAGAQYGNTALNEIHYIDDVKLSPSGWERRFVGARPIAEAIAAPTDAVARIYTANRAIAENVAAVTDSVARQFVGARSVGESIAAPTDAVTRQFAGARTVNENIAAPTDLVARILLANRTINENVPKPTDSVARQAFFNRAIAEAIAKVTDAVARQVVAFRVINENVPAPTDSLTRHVVFNRTIIEILPGEGGGGTTITKKVLYIFDD